ncbi:dihydrofolate reductase family protein [Luteimicrobium xylanilyticum]|uniref:Dihydrofolate reductase n=1 Tax=Luteimicrobium xylanilyticum TaxID=1133546 RepID=A0A5P9QHX6_9MICO|nr:dihydrofolate reductase family protein [Luteimicrobium xylanilyticum]QFV00066.1 Dihydrofolate reductase [Luteimicrobium xylanilyticum]
MARLRYLMLTSLDGYAVDAGGRFDWAMPDEELHAAVNDASRDVGTYLYGRRMYETMAAWQTMAPEHPAPGDPVEESAAVRDFARLWRAADKIVFSTTLDDVATPRTDLVDRFDPDEVRALVETAGSDVAVGGPTLAAAAFAAGLVDAVTLCVFPVSVGGGLPALPPDQRVDLRLTGVRRFASGVVQLDHDVVRA